MAAFGAIPLPPSESSPDSGTTLAHSRLSGHPDAVQEQRTVLDGWQKLRFETR